jgi:2-polyprenyl-3-methyl-5-hydroxy-6-metoxy-1,4-benzoquinol methylase
MIWCCPRCRADLAEAGGVLRCGQCYGEYQTVAGIPDLRLPGANWIIDYEADLHVARELAAKMRDLSLEQAVRGIFAKRPDFDDAHTATRTKQVLAAPQRLRGEIAGWLAPCVPPAGAFLDLGCGPGMLIAAAALSGRRGIGIDVSMTWLVVAKRLIEESGGEPVLAAALAESLPLADGAVDSVIALDVIEHVADPTPFLREIDRVTSGGGHMALATPNRFSLAAEPHVAVWGVGWVPRRWQKRYVKWSSGKSYDYVQLLSTFETARLIRRTTHMNARTLIPPVSSQEIARFPAYRAALAKLYNALLALFFARWIFLVIGPFFRVIGTKAK